MENVLVVLLSDHDTADIVNTLNDNLSDVLCKLEEVLVGVLILRDEL